MDSMSEMEGLLKHFQIGLTHDTQQRNTEFSQVPLSSVIDGIEFEFLAFRLLNKEGELRLVEWIDGLDLDWGSLTTSTKCDFNKWRRFQVCFRVLKIFKELIIMNKKTYRKIRNVINVDHNHCWMDRLI